MMTPGSTIAHYRIVSKLGEGGMGAVYRATDTKLQRDVAIKVLPEAFARDEERLGRLVREAQVLASLNHPNIATIYGLEERAIVMELVEGPTLADRLEQGALPLEEALAVARQIGEALEVAHERGIIHRDLKPANVKLTAEGQVKVLDFGLAKLTDAAEPGEDPASAPTVVRGNSPTLTGVIMGTAGYMAPEQARGLRVDKRADIWAFGVVLFEMLTGRGLYSGGETMADTLAAVILKDPEWGALPAGTPRGVRRLLERCLQRDRKKRLRDIGDAWVLLEEEVGVVEVVAAPVAVVVARRTVVPWVVAAVCAVGAFGVGFRHFRETPEPAPVLRYEITAPEEWRIHTFALSPDGRYLAVAAEGQGKQKLWIRPMGALQFRALERTEGAAYPFWSPDSRSIGFFADGKLKRIEVEGGPAQVLCAVANGRGGSWSREGVIVFAPTNNGELQRVPAAGGAPTAATQVEGGVPHRFPVFLEDGRRFLFTAAPGPQEKEGIYEGSLDSKQVRRVSGDVSSAIWFAGGEGGKGSHLLFLRESTLMAQPFDAKTLRPVGEVVPVAEGVTAANIHHAQAAVSRNGLLVYVPGRRPTGQLSWFDRTGKQLGDIGRPMPVWGLALAPDGKTVAMPRQGSGSRVDLWLQDIERGMETRFTFDDSVNFQPIFSPDGKRVAFTSNRLGGGSTTVAPNLFVKETNGGMQEERLLPVDNRSRYLTDWSRDGKFLLYNQFQTNGFALWVLPLEGERKPNPYLDTEFAEIQGKFSPDGRWVAYASNESGRYEVYVRPFPAGPGKWRISSNGGDRPLWRDDGQELFYVASNRLMSVEVKTRPGAQPAFEAGAPAKVLDRPVSSMERGRNGYPYAVSPDGKRILMFHGSDTGGEPVTVVQNWLEAAASKR